MNMKLITSAITSAAGKVFKMKTSKKIAIGAAAAVAAAATGVAVAKTAQARKQERSVRSLVIEDITRTLPVTVKREPTFEESMEKSAQPFVLPQIVRNRVGLTELDEFTDTFVLEPKEKTSDMVIFYLHGTNYWYNPSRYHYAFIKRLANRLGTQLILPVYPKAPAHTAVDIQQMVLDRYLYLINEKKIPAEKIVFIGDAAGGGLALAMLQKLRYLAYPMPGQAFLISPWLDVTNSDPAIKEIQPNDSILNAEKLTFKGEKYAGDLDPTHPMVSPIYGDLSGLCPITVFAGSREIFCADAQKLCDIAEEKELDIEVYIYKNQMHFFVGLPIPEGEEAIDIIAMKLYGIDESDEIIEFEETDAPELAEAVVCEDGEEADEEATAEVTAETFEELDPETEA